MAKRLTFENGDVADAERDDDEDDDDQEDDE